MKISGKHSGGFSLVELMIAAAISLLVIAIAGKMMLMVAESELKSAHQYEMDTQLALFGRLISRDVLPAKNVGVAGDSKIELEVVRLGGDVDYVVYELHEVVGERDRYYLSRSADGETAKELVSDIVGHEITYYDFQKNETNDADDARYVQVEMNLSRTVGDQLISREIVTPRMLLRNKSVLH